MTKKENPRLVHVLGRTYAACANGIVAIFRAKTKEQAESKAEKNKVCSAGAKSE